MDEINVKNQHTVETGGERCEKSTDHSLKHIRDLELGYRLSVSDLIENMKDISFNARNIAQAASVWLDAILDEDTRIYFTLAGAMVPGGLRRVVATMIEYGMIDVLTTTGANMVHDGLQGFAHAHYQGSADADDEELREQDIFRIYDVFIPHNEWTLFDNWIEREFYPHLAKMYATQPAWTRGQPTEVWVTPSEMFQELGKYLLEEKKDNGILATAYKHQLPIYCPAFMDCMFGILLDLTNRSTTYEQGYELKIDQTHGYSLLLDDMAAAKSRAVVVVGGGSPKNFIFQTSEALTEPDYKKILDLEDESDEGFRYAVAITTDSPHWGGLSGATLREAVSWKKIGARSRHATVYCDATIALPLIVQTMYDELVERS